VLKRRIMDLIREEARRALIPKEPA
jgi:hypothetical protein